MIAAIKLEEKNLIQRVFTIFSTINRTIEIGARWARGGAYGVSNEGRSGWKGAWMRAGEKGRKYHLWRQDLSSRTFYI